MNYTHISVHVAGKNHEQLSEEAVAILKDRLKIEYELYNFLRQRLNNQWMELQEEKKQGPS